MSAKIVVEVTNDDEYDERYPTYFDAKQVGEAALAMADRIHYVNDHLQTHLHHYHH